MASDNPNASTLKKVLCLGGAGGMGETLARHLARSERIGTLIIADLDGDGASRLAKELSADSKCAVRAEQIDVLNEASLKSLLGKVDFVANAAGPFFRLGVPTLNAAIETGTSYLDICDDPQPTLDMMALDAKAKAAGVSALIGMGASPGISNLLAVRAASRLDEIHDCYTAWPLDVDTPGQKGDNAPLEEASADDSSAAVVHLMEQISGKVHVVRDGELVETSPLQTVTLDFPGMGTGSAVIVGHPEPVTLHKNLAVKGNAANIMLITPSTEQYLLGLGRDIDKGKISLEDAAEALLKPKAARAAKAALTKHLSKGPGTLPPFFAYLTGIKDGQMKSVGCHATTMPTGMDGITSIPAALAVDMLLASPAEPGVHAPEAIIDADTMLDNLRVHCPEVPKSVDDLAPISEADL